MSVSMSLIISPDEGYPAVDAPTMSIFACAVRRCFSYAPDRMYFHWQKGHLLAMLGVSSVYMVSFV